MKRVYVNEKWCLGCHLCEYNCAYANSGIDDMVKALKGKTINPRIRIEEGDSINFAVQCRHPTAADGRMSGGGRMVWFRELRVLESSASSPDESGSDPG